MSEVGWGIVAASVESGIWFVAVRKLTTRVVKRYWSILNEKVYLKIDY